MSYSLKGICLSSSSRGEAGRTKISLLDRKCFMKTFRDYLQKGNPREKRKPFLPLLRLGLQQFDQNNGRRDVTLYFQLVNRTYRLLNYRLK